MKNIEYHNQFLNYSELCPKTTAAEMLGFCGKLLSAIVFILVFFTSMVIIAVLLTFVVLPWLIFASCYRWLSPKSKDAGEGENRVIEDYDPYNTYPDTYYKN
jgi:hypothetical protein